MGTFGTNEGVKGGHGRPKNSPAAAAAADGLSPSTNSFSVSASGSTTAPPEK